ncbi:helix-turn-helix transcriptional regulator [Microvirga sp. ACRRW]|jgi:transcriptional regulator with XRE-family HTH domain|uniref:helix-turn-helix domain-containing protein n=1 Tax=Microvirga sp. ACRRW TaxID=2918205 RepID=UPI001EF6FDC9|nr:helix-turn-helix transcriptional regulator [Microvirga sp. ACRRW]MCG7394246.1 helix-turn-helix transcriptional regulator [Microvirga sp. ACRRW]
MKKSTTDIDRQIGNKIRARRIALNISQEKLSDSLGLTFQQVQKYEKGTNRVSASRLLEISQILKVDIDYFFAGLVSDANFDSGEDKELGRVISTTEGVRLIRAFAQVEDIQIQRKIVDLVEMILKIKGLADTRLN